jgi:hypothetical protein
VSENARLVESTPVIRQAIGLLDDSLQGISARERWCQGAWAKDAAGTAIGGAIIEAIESEQVASRCAFAKLVHQGLARGFRIEISVEADVEQVATEVTRAPASWMLAATALVHAALVVATERQLCADEEEAEQSSPSRPLRRREFVLLSVVVNDLGSYEDAITCLALGSEMLRAELDRRAQEQT